MPEETEVAEAGIVPVKPNVNRVADTSHWYGRDGRKIDHIVIHYTTSAQIEGTIVWFQTAPVGQRTSAHYIVGVDGVLVQMVPDDRAAWHAGSKPMNLRSIGIEHVARKGDRLTAAQSRKSLALIAWLMAEYDIPRANVIPHKCVKPNTDCCGDILAAFGATAASDCKAQKAALDRWLATAGL